MPTQHLHHREAASDVGLGFGELDLHQSLANSMTLWSGSRTNSATLPRLPEIEMPAAASAASVFATSAILRAMWVMPGCFSGTSIRMLVWSGSGALTMKLISRPDGCVMPATFSGPNGP